MNFLELNQIYYSRLIAILINIREKTEKIETKAIGFK